MGAGHGHAVEPQVEPLQQTPQPLRAASANRRRIPTADFRVLQATQRPFDAGSFIHPTTAAAWKTIPSWGLVAGRDKAIPPACERWMYSRASARKVVEVPNSSHVVMISHPKVVADLIGDAAEAIS
ncbi:alpha/beta hydrolase family protein [Streptomyces sp. Ag109_O5-1]|nr:alpha/beta hydrolase family protein [Streptomyces sp. Ag109_O5-1]